MVFDYKTKGLPDYMTNSLRQKKAGLGIPKAPLILLFREAKLV